MPPPLQVFYTLFSWIILYLPIKYVGTNVVAYSLNSQFKDLSINTFVPGFEVSIDLQSIYEQVLR